MYCTAVGYVLLPQSRLRAKYRRKIRTENCAVEEAYLRDDIACGVPGGACGGGGGSGGCPPLSEAGSSLDPRAPAYLIPDAETLDALLEASVSGGPYLGMGMAFRRVQDRSELRSYST